MRTGWLEWKRWKNLSVAANRSSVKEISNPEVEGNQLQLRKDIYHESITVFPIWLMKTQVYVLTIRHNWTAKLTNIDNCITAGQWNWSIKQSKQELIIHKIDEKPHQPIAPIRHIVTRTQKIEIMSLSSFFSSVLLFDGAFMAFIITCICRIHHRIASDHMHNNQKTIERF